MPPAARGSDWLLLLLLGLALAATAHGSSIIDIDGARVVREVRAARDPPATARRALTILQSA
jgi:hypothetical protein